MKYPFHLLKLIQVLKRFPGVGNKSAERYAFHLISWPEEYLEELGQTILKTKDRLKHCQECGCLMDDKTCQFCDATNRKTDTICVLASSREVFSIEETHEYTGLYHVLGGILSPMENRGPEHLNIDKLIERIKAHNITEIIIALDSTLEGDATALYIKEMLASLPVHISRLAFGLPMGSSLEYVNGGTLARALTGRHQF